MDHIPEIKVNITVKGRKNTLSAGDIKGTWLKNMGTQKGHEMLKGHVIGA